MNGVVWIPFWALALIWALAWLGMRCAAARRGWEIGLRRELRLLPLFLYSFVVLRLAFFPYNRIGGHIQPLGLVWQSMWPPHVNLVPFANLVTWQQSVLDVILNLGGNVALFVPLGLMLPLSGVVDGGFWETMRVACVASLAIELLQLPLPARVTDVDDLMLNVLGAALGYGLYALATRLLRGWEAQQRPSR